MIPSDKLILKIFHENSQIMKEKMADPVRIRIQDPGRTAVWKRGGPWFESQLDPRLFLSLLEILINVKIYGVG